MDRLIKFSVLLILCLNIGLLAQNKFKLDDAQPGEKSTIAVLPLDNNGVTEAEAKALTERLSIEIVRHNKYEVMERQKMNSILNEMSFQLSDCTSDECAIEIGQMIGVEKMVAGSVSKVGEYYTVSARIIDVETSRIELTGIVDMEGTIGQVLTKAIPSIAKQLCQAEEPGFDNAMVEKNVGYLKIGSTPPEASVFVNNMLVGITPLTVELNPGVENIVRVAREGFAPWQKTYTVEVSQVVEINVKMIREVVEPDPVVIDEPEEEKERPRRKGNRAFRLSFLSSTSVEGLNSHVDGIGGNLLFEMYPMQVANFQGLEISSGQRFAKQFYMDFSIGVMISQPDDKNRSDIVRYSDLEIAYYMPYLMLDARFYPLPDGIINPYAIIGFGYNYMMLDVLIDDEAEAGVGYASGNFKLGLGLDLKLTPGFGVGIEYDILGTNMKLTEAGDDAPLFKRAGLKEIDLDKGHFKIQLNFYSRQ
ncbi:MAG: PEGA domain-containing protein [Candidatus Marinimicrobia bacterium]|nr:PEGA domain-containing protein [Candidatus Neomarinimicrobiota bacterium]